MKRPKIITDQQTAFIKFELDYGDSRRKKRILQDLSGMYRRGFRFKPESLIAIETTIDGLVIQGHQDKKVVRWGLNTLAQIGSRLVSDNAVKLALRLHEGDPEIIAAAIAALSHMYSGRIEELEQFRSCDPSIRTLAALQNTDPKLLDLSRLKINVDTADKEIIKLALITIGLNRSVDNLFHPRIGNGSFVKALGVYPDHIVVQYAVWAIIENQKLDMNDLGVDITRIEDLPPNVQAKVLELVALREVDPRRRHSILMDGPFLSSPEAREGMAKGIQSLFYDGLEGIILDWVRQERNIYVRKLLAQHIAKYSDVCILYEEEALNMLEQDQDIRQNILFGAEGRPLYRRIKLWDLKSGTADLFGNDDELNRGISQLDRAEIKMLKVLFLAASPKNVMPLRLDQEARDLKEKLKYIKNKKLEIKIIHEWAVRVDQIQDVLFNARPHILHFSGHGGVGNLIFEDVAGNAAPVEAAALGQLIGLHASYIEGVVLNACFSSDVAREARNAVKWVIGCDNTILDEAAIAFSRSFYRALANGEISERAFKHARNEVALNLGSEEADKYIIL